MSYRLLLVEPDAESAAGVERALVEHPGYAIRSVKTFAEALAVMTSEVPDLLIASIRLGAFNGFHLILRSRALYPSMPSFLIGHPVDRSVEIDQLAVRFVEQPLNPESFLHVVIDSLRGCPPSGEAQRRRWPRKPIEIAASVSQEFGRVLNLSYGGLRFESQKPRDLGAPVQITFPTLGFAVTGVPRWQQATEPGQRWVYGVEVQTTGFEASYRWRGLVDSLN